jgi:hypothetical protein
MVPNAVVDAISMESNRGRSKAGWGVLTLAARFNRKFLDRLATSWPWSLLIVLLFCGGCMPSESTPAAAKEQRASKIAPELIALHQEYAAHLAASSQEPFRSRNKLLQIVDGHVIIDAVAAGETSALRGDLTALGMRNAVSFGRMVSGQLPIAAIPQLAKLPSLAFARAAVATTQ